MLKDASAPVPAVLRQAFPDSNILVAIPAFNEGPTIGSVVLKARQFASDVVIGVRWGKTSRMPMYRRLGKRALDYATAAAAKNGLLTDSQSGYRVFSRHAVESLEPTEDGLSIESQLLLEAQERSLRIEEVNIDSRHDLDGSTISAGKHGTGVLGRIIVLVSEKRPLFFFGVPGALFLVVAAIIASIVLETFITSRVVAQGYASLVVLFGTVGFVSIFIGLTLNALKRLTET